MKPDCDKCGKPMKMVSCITAGGSDGRKMIRVYRCSDCWEHRRIESKRQPLGFQERANL